MKDLLSKAEVHFWITIIGGLAFTLMTFFNLKVEVAEAKKDIAIIRENVADIKDHLRRQEDKNRGTFWSAITP